MTQQEEQEFMESLEVALSWMRTVQERLRANDNTQGPRDALEARLRETEKIHQSEHEGRVKMEMALAAAENLLQSGDEELRNYTHVKLKDLKSLWEETCTYIVHCHSRIEWVWLHWSEYLKAYEEFELWLSRHQRILDIRVELQLGVKEKLWQVDQQRVLVSDIHSQTTLLERLLDEAAALHNRTQDPSVEPQAQEQLQESYNTIRDRAEEQLTLLQKIAEEHQTYQGCVQKFQYWLLSKTKELTELMEREDTAENKLKALQALDDNVASEEKTLQHIESVAEAVRGNTSPAGAGLVVEEAEELRLGWQRLRQGLCEAEEGLRSSLDSHSQYVTRCQRLGEDISRLRILMQRLDQELEERHESTDQPNNSEEQVVGQWKTYRGVKNTLAGEESQVELLKAQLKELFRFSEDSRHLSDDVLAVVKEHQSVKCRATRLCSESQSELKKMLQDPLLVYAQWSHMVSEVLEASAEVTDFSHIAMLVQKIESLLKDSVDLQERFSLLQIKGDLLESVFGPERSDGLQDELSTAIRNRELLHTQLLQRKSRLQGLISRIKDFDEAHDLIVCKLNSLQNRLLAVNSHQPDILAKKSQSDQLGVILKDLQDSEAHIIALETLVSSSQSNRTQFDKLYADWKHLHKAVQVKMHENEESIVEHESFHESLLNIEKWLMILKQKLESFHSPSGEWSIEGRQHEAERALGEFPEKEMQLQHMEIQGHRVLQKTSVEGQVHIMRDMKRLQQSWLALHSMSLNLHSLLSSSKEQRDSDLRRVGVQHVDNMSVITEGDSQVNSTSSRSPRGQQPDKPTEFCGVLASTGSVREGSLEGGVGKGVMTEPDGWYQDPSEELPLAGQNNEPLNMSNSGLLSSKGDQVDMSIYCRAGKKVSKDSTIDRNLDSDKSSEHSSSILAGDRGETVFTTKISHDVEGILGSAEGGMHSGQGPCPGRGAFTLFRRDPIKQPSAPPVQHTMRGSGQYISRRREFEAWLSQESEILSGILHTKEAGLSEKELKTCQDTLKVLRAGVAWGQEQFQLLLQESLVRDADSRIQEDIEDLRYRWMLHKSKLKDVGSVRFRKSAQRIQAKEEELPITAKAQKKAGLLQRVCRLALPLWLFLLALLLLAFLLPLMDEGNSCSLSNNFARSFNIMLRYNGPPPT